MVVRDGDVSVSSAVMVDVVKEPAIVVTEGGERRSAIPLMTG